MATFGFGRLIEREGRRGRVRVPEYSLHIQCQWRVIRDGAIHVGYGDWHWPPSGSGVDYWDFKEADAPRNRRDELLESFVGHGQAAHVVQSLTGATTGDLEIAFTDGCLLQVFANYATGDAGHDEYWRLLSPDEQHFVVTAHGIDT